jgi:uncharacterized membrane protein YdjX (TVP38/TMEM64 family)
MRTGEVFASARSRRLVYLVVAALLVFVAATSLLVGRYSSLLTDPFALREWIRGYGPLAPVVFVALQAAQVIVAPIPGQVLGLASGFLFGTLWGTVYSLVGATVGSVVVFWLSRRLGRPFVEQALTAETLAKFDRFSTDDGPVALFLVFLVPGLPDDVICFCGGLTGMSIPKMVAISVVGRFPGYLVINATGAGFGSDRVMEAVLLLVALVAISVVGYRYRERLFERILGR